MFFVPEPTRQFTTLKLLPDNTASAAHTFFTLSCSDLKVVLIEVVPRLFGTKTICSFQVNPSKGISGTAIVNVKTNLSPYMVLDHLRPSLFFNT